MSPSDDAVGRLIRKVEALEKEVERLKTREFGGILLYENKLTVSTAYFDVPITRTEFKVLTILGCFRTDRPIQTSDRVLCQINGSAAAAYYLNYISGTGAALAGVEQTAQVSWTLSYCPTNVDAAGLFCHIRMNFLDYADATKQPTFMLNTFFTLAVAAGGMTTGVFTGGYDSAVAVSSVKILPRYGPNFVAGSWVRIYGDKG